MYLTYHVHLVGIKKVIEEKHAFLEVFPSDVVVVIKHRYSHKRLKAYVRP